MTEFTHNNPRIEMMRITDLTYNKRSGRTHSASKRRKLTASIREFGFIGVVIIDKHNNIIAGNAKCQAAQAAGCTEVPCIRYEFMSEAHRRAFVLTENALAADAGWDMDIVADELKFLLEANFEIGLTGFSLADLDFSVGSSASENDDRVDLPANDAKPVSLLGDLWLIGPHKIFCGDSRDMSSYDVLLGDERASMIISDPPYNVKIDGHVSGNGKVKHRPFAFASGEMSPPEFTMFLRSIFQCCAMFSVDGSIHYHFMDFRHMREMLDAGEGVYGKLKQLIVWNKGSGSLGAFYRSQHELVFCWKSGKAKHINNFMMGETGRLRTNIWDYKGASTFYKGRQQDLSDHPTIKNLALVMDAILDVSHRGDIVLDPFCGSGTSVLAAHRTGRRGMSIEVDPIYVDTALRRLADATGIEAVHADGRSFSEVAIERQGSAA